MKGFVLGVFAAMVFASGWLPKGLTHSGKTDVSTHQIVSKCFPVSSRSARGTAPQLTSSKETLLRRAVSGASITFQVVRSTIRPNQRNATSAIKTL